ncbi:hypothetical protein DIPPA_08690 [Diplonema papillatum]|nr:hypothetical protein DIPPA_08690 [Diplonema papillatum]
MCEEYDKEEVLSLWSTPIPDELKAQVPVLPPAEVQKRQADVANITSIMRRVGISSKTGSVSKQKSDTGLAPKHPPKSRPVSKTSSSSCLFRPTMSSGKANDLIQKVTRRHSDLIERNRKVEQKWMAEMQGLNDIPELECPAIHMLIDCFTDEMHRTPLAPREPRRLDVLSALIGAQSLPGIDDLRQRL